MRKKQIVILGVVMGVALLGLIFTQASYFRTAFKLKKAQFDYLVNKSINETISVLEEKDRQQSNREKPATAPNRSGKNGPIQGRPLGLDLKPGLHGTEKVNIVRDYSGSPVGYDSKSKEASALFGKTGNQSLQNSIEKSRQELKNSLGKDYDLMIVSNAPGKTLEERISGINLKQVLTERLTNNGITAKFEFAVKEKGQFTLMSQNFLYRNSEYVYNRKMYFGETQSVASLILIFPEQAHDLLSSIFLLLPSLIITILLVICFSFCITVIIRQKRLSVIKNDFINNMTHEFKTPIATISLASQMLKDGAVNHSPTTIDHIAGIIRDESKRLTFQVEKVLQTALFTETRMKLKLKNVNLNEVVENLVGKFSLRVEDKGGQLSCYLEADNDEVYADEVHITNVISNLLDNAIKYCVKIPEVNVYTRNKGSEIIISVIDNGIGIATKEQKLIFERFYRVSTGNLHNVKGFGLGLSYVKTIVEAHGGRIEVESAEGKGSRFDVILPLTEKKQKVKRTLFF
ncbi:MAG: HAMP domain-containing histidine kinase [Odoribacter sp.]|nr:HAMP domain-containing histidine kinase [Odoribacter sp.]